MENEELNQEINRQIGQFVDNVSNYLINRILGLGRDEGLVYNAIQIIDNYTPGAGNENNLTAPINQLKTVTEQGNKRYLVVLAKYGIALGHFYQKNFNESFTCITEIINTEVTLSTLYKDEIHQLKKEAISLTSQIIEIYKAVIISLNEQNEELRTNLEELNSKFKSLKEKYNTSETGSETGGNNELEGKTKWKVLSIIMSIVCCILTITILFFTLTPKM